MPVHEIVTAGAATKPRVRYTITARLREDTHVGSGAGGAGLDALVLRDRHGRPMIPASHLKGLLRDSARALLGDSRTNALFGERGGSRQALLFTSLYSDSSPESRVWRSSARESYDNRAPKEDTLRAIEFVPAGTVLRGFVEGTSADFADLERLRLELDSVGHGRATGAGKVELNLTLEQPKPRSVGPATTRLLIVLQNLDPLCVSATATPGNIIPTWPFIPGRALLGALAAFLVGEAKLEAGDLLVGGAVSVSDALPLPSEFGIPGRIDSLEVTPAPLALQSDKPQAQGREVPWWAWTPEPLCRLNAHEVQGKKLKRPEADLFVCRSGGKWSTFRPTLRVRLRNGRPQPDQVEPSLFAVEQIAEGTSFLAELRGDVVTMEVLRAALLPVLEGGRWLRMGRGGTPVEVSALQWLGASQPSSTSKAVPRYLTLTSDLLVRDDELRWITFLQPGDWTRLLEGAQPLEVSCLYQDGAPVRGFNGTSRVWRMPAAAVRRGSVYEVSGPGVQQLVERASKGQWLGERTHEGFGRFRLDQELPGVTSAPATKPTVRASTGPDAPEEAIAKTTRSWLAAHPGLASPSSAGQPRPSFSQWQRLVTELTEEPDGAVTSRNSPTAAGAAGWRDVDATAILNKLLVVPREERSDYARMFVRWLRAAMREKSR